MPFFTNPILPGFHPDPSICRVGGDYYLVNSSFEYFPGLPIHHSRDLTHWRLIGNALDRPSQLPLKGATDTSGLYAPTLRHHNGVFHITCTNMGGNGGAFIVTARDPDGPWSEPLWLGDGEADASLLFDDDGKVYYTKHAGGEWAGISQAELDPATLKLATPFRVIYNNTAEPWNEGPHLYKINGWYYLLLAEGGTELRHQAVIARARSPWGPFEASPRGPVLTHRDRPHDPLQCTGHADLVQAQDGGWWAVFLGVRPQQGVSVLGRETFLAPVHWDTEGWPVAGEGHHVALAQTCPALTPHPWPAQPARRAFAPGRLSPEWLHIRAMDPRLASLEARPGWLRLLAAADGIDSAREAPAFAGLRQPEIRATARCELDFAPGQDGDEAGLCARSNEGNHYEVALTQRGGARRVFVRTTVKGVAAEVAGAPAPQGPLWLEIACDERTHRFAWSPDGQAWTALAASPAANLSKEISGGFTGAVIGLYATAQGRPQKGHADFRFMELGPGAEPTPTNPGGTHGLLPSHS